MSEQTPLTEENKEQKQEEKKPDLRGLLATFDNAPDDSTIEQWKQQHGEVFCSGLSKDELFIFRPLTRGEFSQLQALIMNSEQQVSNLESEQHVVEACLLWSSPAGQSSFQNKAGTLSTLHEQVMQNSNFVDPRMASALVMKL